MVYRERRFCFIKVVYFKNSFQNENVIFVLSWLYFDDDNKLN